MSVARMVPWTPNARTAIGRYPWSQHVDLCQVRDPATGNRLASISASYDGLERAPNPNSHPRHHDADRLIRLDAAYYRLALASGGDIDTSSVTLTIDLGASYLLSCVVPKFVQTFTPIQQWKSRTAEVQISTNGTDYVTTVPEKRLSNGEADSMYMLSFPARQGRYIKLRLAGIVAYNPAHMILQNIAVYPSIFHSPAFTVLDGIPAVDLADQKGNLVIKEASGTAFTSGSWFKSTPKVNGYATYYGLFGAGEFWSGLRSGDQLGTPVTTPATQIFDLQSTCPIMGIEFNLARGPYQGDNTWDFGCKIEGTDNLGGSWTVMHDSSTPFAEQFLSFIGSDYAYRYLRVTNKNGTYPAGTFDRQYFDADVSGQTGCGLASYAIVPYVGSTTGERPKKTVSVQVGPLKFLSLQVANNTGKAIQELVSAAPVVPGSTYDFTWDGLDHRGTTHGTGTVSIRAAGSEASWTQKTAVGLGGPLGNQPLTDQFRPHTQQQSPSHSGASCVDPAGRIWIAGPEEEQGGGEVLASDGTFLSLWNSDTVTAVCADNTHFWCVQAGAYNSSSTTLHVHRRQSHLDSRVNDPTHSYLITSTHNNDDKLRQSVATWRTMRRIHGLAVQPSGSYLFVSDYTAGKIITLNKADMSVVQSTARSFTNPLGIALDPRGTHLWVCHSGDTVSCHEIEAGGTLGAAVATINVLDDPSEVATCDLDPGGSHDYRLVVLEYKGGEYFNATRTARVREYNINTIDTPSSGGTYATFGTNATCGTVSDTAWFDPCGLSIDNSGNLLLGDRWCYRTLRFRYSDGACFQRNTRPYGVGCWVDPTEHTANTFRIWIGGMVFEVNPDETAWTPLQGGLADGRSRLVEFWFPTLRMMGFPGKYTHSATFYNGAKKYMLASSQFSSMTGFTNQAYALSEPSPPRLTSLISQQDRGLDLLGSSNQNAWQAKDTDGSGGLFTSGERTYIGEAAYWFSTVSRECITPTGRLWLPHSSPTLISGGQPAATVGKKVFYLDPVFEDIGGGKENAVYDFKANLVGFTNDANLVNPFGNTVTPMMAAELPDGRIAIQGTYSNLRYIGLYASDGTQTWSVPTPTGPDDAPFQFVHPDPQSRFVWETGTGEAQHWICPRELTYGLPVATVGNGVSTFDSSWCDFANGAYVFDFHGRTLVAMEDNGFGQAHIYEVTDLDTVQTDSASFTWVDLDTWDEGDAPTITFSGSPSPGGSDIGRDATFRPIPGFSAIMEL